MSKKKNKKKIENKKLIAELHKKQSSKSETAKKMQNEQKTEKDVKIRDVKQFIVQKTNEQLKDDKRAVIQQERNYMMNRLSDNLTEVYNATIYFNAKTKKDELLTQKIANELVFEFVSKNVALFARFTAQDIMNLHQTKGGAYGDKVRKPLYAMSLLTTVDEIENNINAVVEKAKAKNKTLIHYDVLNNCSKRKRYEFIKVQEIS